MIRALHITEGVEADVVTGNCGDRLGEDLYTAAKTTTKVPRTVAVADDRKRKRRAATSLVIGACPPAGCVTAAI
jgi:hypothetical protein